MFPDIKSCFWKYCIYFHTSSCEINNPVVNNAEAQQRYKAIKYYEADNKPLQRVNIGICMEVFLRLKDLHAYGKICESVHKTASANKICKRKRSFAKV